jgi:hypothetical protein
LAYCVIVKPKADFTQNSARLVTARPVLKYRMIDLFGPVGIDDTYNAIRNAAPDDPQLGEARAFTEQLWTKTAPYLDYDLPKKLTEHFPSVVLKDVSCRCVA